MTELTSVGFLWECRIPKGTLVLVGVTILCISQLKGAVSPN
jgi:hypothetical protein